MIVSFSRNCSCLQICAVLGTVGHPPTTTSSAVSVHIAWLIRNFSGDQVSCPYVFLSIRSVLSWIVVAFFLSGVVVFHCLCTIKVDSSEVRSTTEDSSRREKGIPRNCGRQPVHRSRRTLLLSCTCQQQDCVAGVRGRVQCDTIPGTIQGEAGTCAASAWDCLSNRNVRGQQRWDINNSVNVKTNVKNMAVLSFLDYIEHFKT